MTGTPATIDHRGALGASPPRADPQRRRMTNGPSETEGAICRALSILHEPGEIIEFRAFDVDGARGTMSGYFDDPAKCAAAIVKFDGKGNLYVTMNPCHPALLSRATNRVQHNAKATTNDADIVCRRWILIDVDPKRPSGTSSTDAQYDASLERGREICAYLTSRGVRFVIFADSGNGAHMYVRVNLPNDDQSTALVKNFLEALSAIFSRDSIDVDRKVFNASRIVKVPGSLACKGDPLPDYPHRRSCLLDVPDTLEITPREVLEELAATAPVALTARKTTSTRTETFVLENWVESRDIIVRKKSMMNGYPKWSINCPWNSDHKGDAFIGQRSSGAIVAGCSHNSCSGKTWNDLRLIFEPDAYNKTQKATQSERQSLDPASPFIWEPPVPFGVHAVPEFPISALPDALGRFVSEVAALTQVPLDLPALLALAVVAAAASRRCIVRVGSTHQEPTNLYVAVVMEPGSRKSATMELLAAPLREAERAFTQAELADNLMAKERRAVEEKRVAYLRDQASKAKDSHGSEAFLSEMKLLVEGYTEIPAVTRLLANDVTPEKLAGILAEQDGTQAILSAEGGIFSILAGRYSQNGVNLDLFLKGHAGEEYRCDRVGRPPEFIPRAMLTMGLAVSAGRTGFPGRQPRLSGTRLIRSVFVCLTGEFGRESALPGTVRLTPRPGRIITPPLPPS